MDYETFVNGLIGIQQGIPLIVNNNNTSNNNNNKEDTIKEDDKVRIAGRADWYKPKHATAINILNSLTNTLENFATIEKGVVKWYICGPTVYDSSHMGHARAYMTFDIIRRVFESYFGLKVFYVMNVTDVDDKIILRARRNYLYEKYQSSFSSSNADDFHRLLEDAKIAFDFVKSKLESNLDKYQAKLDKAVTSQEKQDLAALVKNEKYKIDQLLKDKEESLSSSKTLEQLKASAAKDCLAEWQDSLHGSSVTDQSVFRAHAAIYENEFLEDIDALGIKRPDVLTRVTEFVPEIIEYIKRIIDNGYAYQSNGSVYFDTALFRRSHFYGKNSPASTQNAAAAGVDESEVLLGSTENEKKNPQDFALWKASKAGEPQWQSPWGIGRPGWHIECSAMASELIGKCMDIHTGGEDLRFPHHDNELAQSEAYFDSQQWVNYFLHAGHLHINGLKMSKSLKNFVTIRQCLATHSPRILRILFLISSWHKTINYSDSSMREAASKEKAFREVFHNIRAGMRRHTAVEHWDETDLKFHQSILKSAADVDAALINNIDTPTAINCLMSLIKDVNKYLSETEDGRTTKSLLLRKAGEFLTKILKVFGVIDDSQIGFEGGAGGDDSNANGGNSNSSSSSSSSSIPEILDAFCKFRDDVRAVMKSGDASAIMKICDEVRDETMPRLGVRMEDGSSGKPSVWKLESKEILLKEMAEKQRLANEKKYEKINNKIKVVSKDLEKWNKASIAPQNYFKELSKTDKSFSLDKLNDQGIPTLNGEGVALSQKAQKGFAKDLAEHVKLHNQYQENIAKNSTFLEDIKKELEELHASLSK